MEVKGKYIKITKKDFKNSSLYDSIINTFLAKPIQFNKISDAALLKFFSTTDVNGYFRKTRPEIEILYLDYMTMNPDSVILSYRYSRYTNYLFVRFYSVEDMTVIWLSMGQEYPYKLEQLHQENNVMQEDVKKEFLPLIYKHSILDIYDASPVTFNATLKVKVENTKNAAVEYVCHYYNEKICKTLALNSFTSDDVTECYIEAIFEDSFSPKIDEVIIKVSGKYCSINLFLDTVAKENGKELLLDSGFLADHYINRAIKDFGDYKKDELIKIKCNQIREDVISNIKKEFSKYTLLINEDELSFDKISKEPFLVFDQDGFSIRNSKDVNDHSATRFDITSMLLKEDYLNCIKKYLETDVYEYKEFIRLGNELINDKISFNELENAFVQLELLQESLDPKPTKKEYTDLLKKVTAKKELYLSIDKEKISSFLNIIHSIENQEDYEEFAEDLFEALENLNEYEKVAVKDELEAFENTFCAIADYKPALMVVRRVLIKREVLKELQKIERDEPDLNLLSITDSIMETLKTIPGEQMGKYLLEKGMNFPCKPDRSIKKIRIVRNRKYRLVFSFGSELGTEREDNFDSIYFWALTKHDKDKGELDKLPERKPTKYAINEFIVYPRDKNHFHPECSREQYKIANCYDVKDEITKPVISYGCAGSGKTTVSLEQYAYISWSFYSPEKVGDTIVFKPNPSELAYITYNKYLASAAKDYLKEFGIEPNCYSIGEYFDHVLNKKTKDEKLISELDFVEWFDTNYSSDAIRDNKYNKKQIYSPLSHIPDLARLIYTYYRGLFRGSMKLMETKDKYLNVDAFMELMKTETYLKTIEEKESIYEICKQYYQYVEATRSVDENELALKIIRQSEFGLNKTKCIIVDEVQDLTEIELIAIIKTLVKGSQRIYFYGDPHQSILPNTFDKSTINKVYSNLGLTAATDTKPLEVTFRTNRHLVQYLMHLEDIRENSIGHTGNVSKINPPAESDASLAWAAYVTNPDLYKSILETDEANCIIVTPDIITKRELLKKYPNAHEARVLTVYEAKGREWDTVILYNMFTKYENYFLDIIKALTDKESNAYDSRLHRMTFNKYYVGCTRSRKCFILIEDKTEFYDEDNTIYTNFLSEFSTIFNGGQIKTYILDDSNFDNWYQEALKYVDDTTGKSFTHAFQRAKSLAVTDEQKRKVMELVDGDPEAMRVLAFIHLKAQHYSTAASLFKRVGDRTHAMMASFMHNPNMKDNYIRELIKLNDKLQDCPEIYKELMKTEIFKRRFMRGYKFLYTDKEDVNNG